MVFTHVNQNIQNSYPQRETSHVKYLCARLKLGYVCKFKKGGKKVTYNQILYWQNVESVRSHRTQESISLLSLAETMRHNYATEANAARSNDISAFNAAENARAHQASEGIEKSKVAESKRHNVATETVSANSLSEAIRHNQEQERIGMYNALVSYGGLVETTRHNQAMEGYSYYDAVTRRLSQEENARHNLSTEAVNWYEASTHRSAQEESARHNLVTESQTDTSLAISALELQNAQRRTSIDATRALTEKYNATTSRMRAETEQQQANLKSGQYIEGLANRWVLPSPGYIFENLGGVGGALGGISKLFGG